MSIRCNRDGTASTQAFQEGAFRRNRFAAGLILQGRQQVEGLLIFQSALDGQRTLSGRRQHHIQRQPFRHVPCQAQAGETGASQDNGLILALEGFAQACVHIATQRAGVQVGTDGQQLRGAP